VYPCRLKRAKSARHAFHWLFPAHALTVRPSYRIGFSVAIAVAKALGNTRPLFARVGGSSPGNKGRGRALAVDRKKLFGFDCSNFGLQTLIYDVCLVARRQNDRPGRCWINLSAARRRRGAILAERRAPLPVS